MSEQNSAPHYAAQAQNISGYRELSQDEIALIEEFNATGAQLRNLIQRAAGLINERDDRAREAGDAPQTNITSSLRWLAIGTSDLQTGLMAVRRAISAPTTF